MTDKKDRSPDEHQTTLRLNAEAQLAEGTAPRSNQGTLSVEALDLLYRRASDPESAAEALKLLHELQTHQVELDLLYEQLQTNEHEMTEDLLHYRALYNLAPVAFLVLLVDGRIAEGNEAAGRLLDIPPEQLANRPITDLVAASDRATLMSMMGSMTTSDAEASCKAHLTGTNSEQSNLTINARLVAAGTRILMVISPSDNAAAA